MSVYTMGRVDVYKMQFQDPFYSEGALSRSDRTMDMAKYIEGYEQTYALFTGYYIYIYTYTYTYTCIYAFI